MIILYCKFYILKMFISKNFSQMIILYLTKAYILEFISNKVFAI